MERSKKTLTSSSDSLKHSVDSLWLNEELLNNTLYSTGIAFVATNTHGEVQQMNPVAEHLTGWTEAAALGKPILEVFHVINKETRAEVENSVVRVLRDGKYIGFETHTILISRDGKEYPIIENGAPICNKSGEIIGVIIFFCDQSKEYKQVEAALKEKVEDLRRFETVVSDSNDAVIMHDLDGKILAWNRGAKETYGYTEAEALEKNVRDIVAETDREAALNLIHRISEGDIVKSFELRRVTKDGRVLDVWLTTTLLTDENGKPVAIATTERDITERNKAEAALREKLEDMRRLATVISDSNDAVIMHDLDGKILAWNRGAKETYGYTEAEALEKNVRDIVAETDREAALNLIHRISEGDIVKSFELKRVTKDGRVLDVWLTTTLLTDENGKPVAIATTERDITERNKAEAALIEKLEDMRRLATVISDSNDAVIMHDLDGKILAWNRGAKETYGYTEAEALEKNVRDIVAETDREAALNLIHRISKGDIVKSFELKRVTKDGRVLDVWLTTTLLTDENGKPVAIATTERDITERNKAEAALIEKLEDMRRLATVVSDSNDAVIMHDLDGKILAWNRGAKETYGYTEAEALGKNVRDIVAETDREAALNLIHRISKGDIVNSFELKRVTKDGRVLDVWLTTTLLTDEKGKPVAIATTERDMTKRKQAEEENILLVTAIEHTAECIVITDSNGKIQYVNPAFEKITGYSRKEAIGKNNRIIKSGKQNKEFYKNLWDTILSGIIWKGLFINKKKDGTLYNEEATISPIKDSNGKITNFVSVKRDVTNEIIMEHRMRESKKMEAIGTLAGGIAHDFNNILSAIMGYTELSIDQVTENTQIYFDLEKILKASGRAKDLVNQILTFSRQREEEKGPMQIEPIVKETLKLIRASLPSNIEIRLNIEPELGTIIADPTQIHQILMNLCTNAGYSMQSIGGILEVSLCNIELDYDFMLRYPTITPGNYILLTISDTGHGMEKKVLERIFEPYFTTKEKSGGTGLGLAVVHGIISGYGGLITAYGEPEKGSVFKVYLPVTKRKPDENGEKPKDISNGHENILFVDDEPDIVDVGKRILESLGYKVDAFTSSIEALEIFQKDPSQFDLVISDMTMPFMSGDELSEELFRIRPDIPIIICSGYSEKITKENALGIGIKAYLGKPLLKSNIAETIRRVLEKSYED